MSGFDFDREIQRRNTDSLKYDFAVERGRPGDVLPLWVADMDFPVAPTIQQALIERVQHGIFGYTETKQDYFEALRAWFSVRCGWSPRPEWLIKTPGVVFALAMAVKAFTEPGDAVLIQNPVYYPFHEVIQDNGRRLVNSELVNRDGRYEIDFADLEEKLRTERVRLLLLCSPHNPVGRVWSREELRRLADLCVQYHVVLVADEIHCDFVRPGRTFTSAASLEGEIREQLVICTAPSKTFNLAGLQVSNIFIPSEALRGQFRHQVDAAGYSQLNTLGLLACRVAYETGGDWLDAVKDYLEGNLAFLRDYLAERLPEIRLIEPEGTYFAWLDCSGLGLTKEELNDLVINRAKLWLDAGHIFGAASEQYQRVVLACTRRTLTQALDQLASAVAERKKEN
ncbi:MAG: pyridoxal phosphate-dependent aminotransferase [Oscillospiraceae bacterium]|nr:pyridoxal phosphate-dependent aminotransferase [Oscillospiraceae bacterium]